MSVRSLYVEPEQTGDEREWPALEMLDVFRIFSAGDIETVALRGLTIEVTPRTIATVRGPSGSGKSTFMHLVAGLDTPSAGEVRVFGRSLGRMSDEELASYRAHDVAVVFQRDNLWYSLTAQENVEASLRLSGVSNPAGRAREALETFGLSHRRSHRASALSGGEQQRVAIAATAAREAKLVLADEPTGELDTANERRVMEALELLRSDHGATVIIVTHSSRLGEWADHVIELRDGRAVS